MWGFEEMSEKPKMEKMLKNNIENNMVTVKVQLFKPFVDFIEDYRKFFGSSYTLEQTCMKMIYNQTEQLFKQLDDVASKSKGLLSASDFFKKHSHLGIVSFDGSEENEEE